MEIITLVPAVIVILILFYCYVLKHHNVFKKQGVPHLTPIPVFGSGLPIVIMKYNLIDLLQHIYDSHPEAKYVGYYEGTRAQILIRDVDLIKSIFLKNFEYFPHHHRFFGRERDRLFGNMMLFLKDEKWKNVRSAVTPALTSSKLKGMFASMSNYAMVFADYVSKLGETERQVELKGLITKFTNDFIVDHVYSVKVDSIKDPNNMFYVYGRKDVNIDGFLRCIKVLLWRCYPMVARLLRLQVLSDKTSNFLFNTTSSVVRARDEQGIRRPDILQTLMDGRNKKEPGLTDDDIPIQVFTFFFGGSDLISSQLSIIIHYLALNSNVQEKLQNEIDGVLMDTQGQPTYDAITSMEYLDAVINEGMRMNEIVSFLQRKCAKRFELPPALPGGKPFMVEPGMVVFVYTQAIHHDPKYFENPGKFDPERFVVDGKRIMNSGTFLPFGLGPRMCISKKYMTLEMKVLLFHLFSRCVVKCCPKTDIALALNKGVLTVTTKNGFWVRVEPRKDPLLLPDPVRSDTCQSV